MRALLAIAGLTVAAVVRAADPAGYVLETADADRVRGTLTVTVRCPRMEATEWVTFAATAPELPGQSDVSTSVTPAGGAVTEKSPLARPVIRVRVPARTKEQKTKLKLTVTYQATLHSRRLKPGEPAKEVLPLSAADRKHFLADMGDIDHKSDDLKAWLRENGLNRADGESDVDFARRVFQAIRTGSKYEYRPNDPRRASAVCVSGRSDCGGLSNLFVAALRANGVPARALLGRWAVSSKPGEKLGEVAFGQWHVKSEFYAAGVGWVPADVASAVVHDRSAEGVRYFGADPGDFLTFHVDPNLTLDTRVSGVQTANNLQIPVWWVVGSGTVDGNETVEDWKVDVLVPQ
jgi:transglutaminase-like putative cysteine protease